MTVFRAHKIALDPTDKQRAYFTQAAGAARFAYNWALEEWERQYAAHREDPTLPKPTEAGLRRQLNALKPTEFPWMEDITKCAVQEAIIGLGAAFRNFFKMKASGKRPKPWKKKKKKAKEYDRLRFGADLPGYPRFKKFGKHDSFCAANEAGSFRCEGDKIKLPIIGWVRLREGVRFFGKLKRVTISREADRWFASILIETDAPEPVIQPFKVVGVDLGVSTFAALSSRENPNLVDGVAMLAGPRALRAAQKRLRRANKALARKKKGSKNREKARKKLARIHARVANIRKDATHKITTMLVKTYQVIGIENLNVRGMLACRQRARGVADAGFFEFRRQLEYKAKLYGATIVLADRWFPSSQTCSCCGGRGTLKGETFTCNDDVCGYTAHRDVNAPRNLEDMAASFAVTACGEVSALALVPKTRVKRSSVKQEPDTEPEVQLLSAVSSFG